MNDTNEFKSVHWLQTKFMLRGETTSYPTENDN